MEISIQDTFSTPAVNYNAGDVTLRIEGRLIPEDPEVFFSLLNQWFDDFRSSSQSELTVTLLLYYYNTSSSKRLVQLFRSFDEMNSSEGKKIQVNWEYEEGDDDSHDDGQDYKGLVSLPFNLIEVEEQD